MLGEGEETQTGPTSLGKERVHAPVLHAMITCHVSAGGGLTQPAWRRGSDLVTGLRRRRLNY